MTRRDLILERRQQLAPAAVRIRFIASDAGPRLFRFRITPRPGEQVTQNNQREALIEVTDRREKILYFEGEPRPEVGFVRRAVHPDSNLNLVVLQRTADNKYLRLGVDNAEQLLSAFPKTREELFQYSGLILGSIEAGAFTVIREAANNAVKTGRIFPVSGDLVSRPGPRVVDAALAYAKILHPDVFR